MNIKNSKVSLISIALLLGLILANVLLALPPRAALSDSKSNPAAETKSGRPKQEPRALPSTKAEDFGSETVEPLRGEEPEALPLEQVEEPQTVPKTAVPDGPPEDDAAAEAGEEEEGSELDPGANATVTTSLNGNEIEIAALVKTFSKLTKRNYIVDNNVKGKVAIHLATPVSIPEALRIFESVLLLKGFTTVPLGKNTYKVIAAKDAKQTTIPMLQSADDDGSDALVTELMRLKNTQASELQQVLQQFVSKDGMVNAFGATNALILIDSGANIKRLVKLVEQLDVPAIDQDITIIPILHAESKDVADKINSILGDKDSKAQDPSAANALRTPMVPGIPPRPGVPGAAASGAGGISTSGEKRQLPLKLIPDERTNSLIVVADINMTQKVRALAEQLDSPVDRSGGKFYVYRLKHADAEVIAQILNAAISGDGGSTAPGSSGSSSDSRSTSSSSNSSLSGRNRSSTFDGGLQGAQARDRAAQSSRQSQGVFGARLGGDSDGGKVNLEGEVTVAADTSTNSLVINASRGDYEKIRELLNELDVKRRQVLVEATILEVSLTKNEGMGIEWQTSGGTDDAGVIGQTNFGGISNLLSNPAALSDLTIAAASSGSIVLPGGITLPSQALLITALSRNQNVNVLSTPTILAIDNEEAEIKVGENVPFVTSTSTNQTNLNNTFNQIERQDVGIKLRITPQISAGDFVVLKIFVEISNVVPGTQNDPNGPTTTIRTTETVVEVKSDQMVVTGGLIADAVTDSSRGVPFLEDLPVLGNFFRRDDNERRRNNLLVFITPRIITDQFVARDQTMVRRDRMETTIDEQQAEPDRSEVLRSDDIDRVVDSHPLPSELPTTITPPQDARAKPSNESDIEILATKRTQERLSHILESGKLGEGAPAEGSFSSGGAAAGDSAYGSEVHGDTPNNRGTAEAAGDDEIEFEVKPSLPGAAPDSRSSLLPRADVSFEPEILRPDLNGAGSTAAPNLFVVLRELSSPGSNPVKLPFQRGAGQPTVGLAVSSEQSPNAAFFQTGSRYTFEIKGTKIKFVCLGAYDSINAARSSHPGLDAGERWYTISERALKQSGWSVG